MVKIGFLGERKRILTPSLSQGEGECSDSKEECSDGKENPHPNHILSYSETSPKERENVVTEKGECSDGKGKRISKLENEKMGWCWGLRP